MKPFRANLISVLLLLGVTASSATAAWWWLAADRSQFYTDGIYLQAERESNVPRDVLWQPPEDVLTQDGARIEALDAHVMADESLMVLTRRSSRGDTDLYVSTRSDRGWSTPEPIDSVNSPDNELAPTLSPDGKRLLFASDRPGGLGGLDIWSSMHTEAGWTRPGPLECNSDADDTDPHVGADPIDSSELVLFHSERPTSNDETDTLSQSVFASGETGSAFLVLKAQEGETLAGISMTPGGDFLYWTSAPIDNPAATQMMRSRFAPNTSSDSARPYAPIAPTPVDASIGALPRVSCPSLTLEGFAVCFTVRDEAGTRLVRAVAREVYLANSTSRGDLFRIIPWVLIALAVVLLLSLLRRGAASVRWQTTLGTLGLMARCVLVSLVLHAALMALLSIVYLSEVRPEAQVQPERRVALRSSSLRDSLSSQLRAIEAGATTAIAPAPPQPIELSALSASRPVGAPQLKPEFRQTVRLAQSIVEAPAEQLRQSTSETLAVAAASRTLLVPDPRTVRSRVPEFSRAAASSPDEPRAEMLLQGAQQFDATVLPTFAPASGSKGRVEAFAKLPASSGTPRLARMPDAVPGLLGQRDTADQHVPDRPSLPPLPFASRIFAAAVPKPAASDMAAAQSEPEDTDDRVAALAPVGELLVPSLRWSENRSDTPTVPMPEDRVSITPAEGPSVTIDDVTAAAPRQIAVDLGRSDMDLPSLPRTRPTIALPDATIPAFDLVGVVVEEGSGRPIAGARVRLDRAIEADLVAATGDDGTFGLSFEQIPENAALTATKDGFAPGAINVAADQLDGGDRLIIRLRRDDPFVIALEEQPEVHHLGDDAFSGRINSQFQRESEGLSLRFGFTLTEDHAKLPAAGAEFRLMAKGTQLKNRVIVNGTRIGTFEKSPADGGFGEQRFAIPNSVLRLGSNSVTIRSVDSPGTDHDDFEIVNLRIVLLRAGDGPI
ncbi:MAG: hypothetical protein AAFO89_05980 [Planctomycetota bacterium]